MCKETSERGDIVIAMAVAVLLDRNIRVF